jgi:TP901 family phage tail tape measure protein
VKIVANNLTLGTLFTADVNQFLQGIGQIKTAVASLQQTFSQAGQGANAMGTGLASAINKSTTALKAQNAAVKASQQQLTGLAGMWQRVQQAMKTSLAYGTAGAAIYAVIDGLKAGVSAIAEYDQALKNLQAITQASDAEMMGLADTIKDVSSKYIFSTKEISDGAVLMGQAGFTATQTMQAMDAAAKLAMGTLEDMSLTVDLLTTTIVSFNMKSVESGRVADVMANAMNRSKLTLDKLRVSFNYVGNSAYEAGITLEETAAAMSVMANSGMRASTIGTAFRQVISNLIAPNRRLREEFQGMGIDLTQLDPKIVGFSTVVQNLSKILVNQDTGMVNMSKAYSLFGLRAAQAAAILARSATDDYPRMLAMMYEVGSATTMADKQMEGLIAKFKNLAANAQLIAIAMGEGGLVKVMRMLADTLLFLVKGLKSFVESGVGQVTTSILSWTAATAAAIIVGKGLVALILSGMIPALISYTRYIMGTVWAMTALQGVSIVDKINMLMSALVAGNPVFLAYAAVIGTIIAAISYWRGAEERQLKTINQSANSYKTASDTLRSYAEVLENLGKKQAKGQDISVEYASTVKRLILAYPQLTGVIDTNIDSLEKNAEKMHELAKASDTKYLEAQVAQLKIYDQQLNDITGKTGELEQESAGLSEAFAPLRQRTTDLVGSFGEMATAESMVGEEAQKVNDIMKKKDQVFVNMGQTWKKAGESIEDIIVKLRELGATEAQLGTVKSALRTYSEDLAKDAQAIEATLANLPHMFTTFFNSLDAMSKVSMAKQIKLMEDEISQYKKISDSILKTDEDRYAAEAFIRTKHLMKFADDVMKEKMTAEQLLKFKQELIEKEKQLYYERLDLILKSKKGIYEDELKTAKDNQQKITAAQEKWNKALLEDAKNRAQGEVAINQGAQSQIVELYKKTAEEVQKSAVKMANDYITELNKMITDAQNKLAKLKQDSIKKDEDYAEKLRKLKQYGMSDSQKFADDEAQVNKLMNLARETNSQEYYDKAASMAESLARDVKDSAGNVVSTEKENVDKVIRYLTTIREESAALFKKEIEYQKQTLTDAQNQLESLKQTLAEFGGEWDKINDQKLRVFIDRINEAADALDRLSIKEGSVAEKSAAAKGEQVQKTPFSKGSEEDWKKITEKLLRMPVPQQPSAGAMPGVTAVQKPPTGEGTITIGGKTYDVKDLAAQGQGTIGMGGKTYDVNALAGQGEGTIGVGGKTFDVKQLADYEGKIADISERIQAGVKESQTNVVKGAEESGKQAVETVGKVGTDITTAITAATDKSATSIGTAVETAKTAQTSIGDMATSVSGISAAALEVNNQFVILGFNASTVKDRLTELRDLIIEIVSKPLTELITQSALDILTSVKTTLDSIKANWDSLKSKTITLTINTVGGSGGGGSGGMGDGGSDSGAGGFQSQISGGDSGGGGDYSDPYGHRLGGLVKAVNSIVTFASKGVKLPGYGGGDRVPVMAEAGEFIINKESTSRFLPVIEAINSNAVSVADFGKRFGGVIRSSMKTPALAYTHGGQVPSGNKGNTYITVKVKPTYMTGSRSDIRKVVADISKGLEDQKKGRGYSNA